MRYIKRITALAAALSVAAGLYLFYFIGSTDELSVVFTSDGHGHIMPGRASWEEGNPHIGGMGALASFLDTVGEDYLLFDSGDFFQGSPEGILTSGSIVVKLMNLLGYDAAALGNHEFDFGQDLLSELASLANFPLLGENIMGPDEGETPLWLSPSFIIQKGDLKIGVIGVITPEMERVSVRENIEGLEFLDPRPAAEKAALRLRQEGADMIILLSHAGLSEDIKTAEVLGDKISIILGGHNHMVLKEPVIRNGVVITQPGSNFRYAGYLNSFFRRGNKRITAFRHRLHPLWISDYAPDSYVEEFILNNMGDLAEKLNEVIGESLRYLPGSIPPAQRINRELALGNLQTDIMRETLGADFAFQNSGGIRAPLFKGPVRVRDFWEVSPFGNHLVKMTLSGSQVRRLLEQSMAQEYSFLQVSGLNLVFNSSLPEGKRVLNVIVVDEDGRKSEIDDSEEYRIVTNSFLAQGGDGYSVFTEGSEVEHTEIMLRDMQIDYIRENSPVSASVEGRQINVSTR